MNTVALSPGNGSQPVGEARSSRLTPLAAPIQKSVPVVENGLITALAARAADESAAPIPTPQASSPRLRETQASNAGDCVPPPSIDPAFFAAWRESQGTTIDAEPRVSR